ncbi:MAG TPA: response regulator transcription factor [Candidatus Angelobacter sp.]|nr:response regulator transcription factor [Candidatus Angelobacter sp.]
MLADDHAIVAEALRSLLRDQYEVVGVVGDGRALVSRVRELKPDLVVADIGMPALNGLDAAEQLKHSMPQVRFVFLTMMNDAVLAAAALRMAPVGFVLKHSASDELLTAIDWVLHGRSFVSPRVKHDASPSRTEPWKEPSEKILKKLTPRQRGVMELVVKGCPMKEIADVLQISEKTVQFHKYEIMKSFNLQSTPELVAFVLKNGLISR